MVETDNTLTVYLGAGSNLGDRPLNISKGLAHLEEVGAVGITRVSSLYESEPVGWDGGPWYLNAVACGTTSLSPERLLAAMQETERWAGRLPAERNAPRTLDLDLLLFGDESINQTNLMVPHPRMLQRAFVLWPLAEIAPELAITPILTALEAARRLQNHETIRLWKHSIEGELPDRPLVH